MYASNGNTQEILLYAFKNQEESIPRRIRVWVDVILEGLSTDSRCVLDFQ